MRPTSRVQSRGQLAAIAWLRWRLFVNALRSNAGQAGVDSRAFSSRSHSPSADSAALSAWASPAFFCLSQGKPELLALLLWLVFFFWQVFPIMATAFTNNPDSSDLLRFPLSYRSYFLVRLAYGAFDPATALGSLWSFGILVGVGFAKPALLPWTLLVLLTFAVFNLLFMQMIFAWVERWLAQRRTREIMGILFVLLMLSFQLIGPLTRTFRKQRAGANDAATVRRSSGSGAGHASAGPRRRCHRARQCIRRLAGAFSSFALLCAFVLVDWLLPARAAAGAVSRREFERSGRRIRSAERSVSSGWAGICPDSQLRLQPSSKKKSAIFCAAAPCCSP